MANKIFKRINTEKTHAIAEKSVYVFLVPVSLNKCSVRKNIEKTFSVKVDDVRTMNMPRKTKGFRGNIGYLSKYKKVYVKLANGMKIDVDSGTKE